jgi:hypothetical protein
MSEPTVMLGYRPEDTPRKVLLFNPPRYDTRLDWPEWQQPLALLQLATLLLQTSCEVELLDALFPESAHAPLVKQRVRFLKRGARSINYWRWGSPVSALRLRLAQYRSRGWRPDDVYIESGPPPGWEGSAEAVALAREAFADARILLFGSYPSLATDHARAHSRADVLLADPIEGLASLPLDLSLYPRRPTCTHLAIDTAEREVSDLVSEFLSLVRPPSRRDRVGHIAFAGEGVFQRFPSQVRAVLRFALETQARVTFHTFGNLHFRDILTDDELAPLLKSSGFKQLIFADNRGLPATRQGYEQHLEEAQEAIERCCAVGYRLRTDDLVASVCLGRLGERLEEVASFITALSHVAGSVIVFPHQPTPAYRPEGPALEEQNGRLFPFAEQNQATYEEYMEILGLAALLDAKYRSRTFDFLGDGLIPRLVRQSLITRSWDPHIHPGPERTVTVGWFDKRGKWQKKAVGGNGERAGE